MNNRLSLSRFEQRPPITQGEKRDFALATLMNDCIKTIELAINNDRQFKAARYEIMAAFHEAATELDKVT